MVIVWLSVLLAGACGQKGPLVLPDETPRKRSQTPGHDVPPAGERRQ